MTVSKGKPARPVGTGVGGRDEVIVCHHCRRALGPRARGVAAWATGPEAAPARAIFLHHLCVEPYREAAGEELGILDTGPFLRALSRNLGQPG